MMGCWLCMRDYWKRRWFQQEIKIQLIINSTTTKAVARNTNYNYKLLRRKLQPVNKLSIKWANK